MSSVDLRDELRAALDRVEPLIAGRVVDIEMARLRVLAEPESFRDQLAALLADAVATADATRAITVRVARAGSSARVDVVLDADGDAPGDVVGSIRLPLAPGASNAAPG